MRNFNVEDDLDDIYSQSLKLSKGFLSQAGSMLFSDYCEDNNIDFDDVIFPYLLKKVICDNSRMFVEYLLENYGEELKNFVIQVYHPISTNATNYSHVAAIQIDLIEQFYLKLSNDDEFYSKYNVRDTRNKDILSLDGKYYIIKSQKELSEVQLNTDFQLLEIKKTRV